MDAEKQREAAEYPSGEPVLEATCGLDDAPSERLKPSYASGALLFADELHAPIVDRWNAAGHGR